MHTERIGYLAAVMEVVLQDVPEHLATAEVVDLAVPLILDRGPRTANP